MISSKPLSCYLAFFLQAGFSHFFDGLPDALCQELYFAVVFHQSICGCATLAIGCMRVILGRKEIDKRLTSGVNDAPILAVSTKE